MCAERKILEDILFHRGRRMRPKANKSADPVERVGSYAVALKEVAWNLVLLKQVAGGQKSYLGADHTESVVYWCKAKDSCEDPSSGQGAESHDVMPNKM